jgi:hypothetical protein
MFECIASKRLGNVFFSADLQEAIYQGLSYGALQAASVSEGVKCPLSILFKWRNIGSEPKTLLSCGSQ